MSGYLHNLALRALRRRSPLHSVALLPFAGASTLAAQDEESPTAAHPTSPRTASPGATEKIKANAAHRPRGDEGVPPRRAPERELPRELLQKPLPSKLAEVPEPLVRPHPLTAAAEDGRRTISATARAQSAATVIDEPHSPAGENTSRPAAAEPVRTAFERQPLVVPSRSLARALALHDARPFRDADSSTEVHLSIARVEVAVLAQEPAPRERRPRLDRTMSLAEYERRRRERER